MSSKADPCVWMRVNKDLKCCEYIASYVDDLCIAAHPGKIIQFLKKTTNLRSKEMDPQVTTWVQTTPGTKTRL